MPVARRAGDPELVGDLLHGARPAAVGACLLIHGLGDLGLTGGEFGPLATGAPPSPGRPQAVVLPHRHRIPLALFGESIDGHGAHPLGQRPYPPHYLAEVLKSLSATLRTI